MDIYLGEPNEKQKIFLKDTHRHVGYGGARGGGKSWGVRIKSFIMACSYKGIRILIMRRTYPELEQNHIIPFRKIIPRQIAKYNKTDKMYTFKNGSIIKFQYCKNDGDLEMLQGAEYDLIFIDEATNFSEYQLKAIAACNRGINDFPKRIYYTCNPGGQGHAYIKRIFVDKKYDKDEDPEDYSFTKALVYDNVELMEKDPDYLKRLEALPPKLKKAWLEGSWDVFEGQFFEEFCDDEEHYIDRQYTHVIEPFDIPPGWKIYRSYDFGYSKPFSCAWWAVDYDGILYRILEFYGCTRDPNTGIKISPDEQFRRIKEIENDHPYLKGKKILGVADPAIWQADKGESIADVAAKYGIFFDKGDNHRISGWMQVHYRLHFDENGYPMMYIFKTCKDFIRTIPLLMYDDTNVEDINTEMEDHIADETRYMCMSRPIKPRMANKPLEIENDPLNQRIPTRKNIYVRRD